MAQEQWSILALLFSRQEGKHFHHWKQHISAACAECQGLESTNGSYWLWLSPHPAHSPGAYFSTSGAVSPAQAMSLQGRSLVPHSTAESIHGSPASHPPPAGHPKVVFAVWLPSMSPMGWQQSWSCQTLWQRLAPKVTDHLLPSSLLGKVEHQEANGSDLAAKELFAGFSQ